VPRPLKIGVQLPEVERETRWSELLDMTRAIEDLGYDSVWLGEHLLYRWPERAPRGPWEAWSMLAAIAASTGRIEFGPLVACTAFHNPAVLAKQAATIDEISGGRLILGLGAGWNETEFRAFGVPFDHRVDRFEEAFTIIRTLLQEGAIDFDGRFYQARDCELIPRGPRPSGPPLMIGSNGPRMLRIAVPHAQAWMAALLGIRHRPAEALDEKPAEAFFGAGKVAVRVHRSEDVIGGNALVKVGDQAGKPFIADDGVNVGVEQVHRALSLAV